MSALLRRSSRLTETQSPYSAAVTLVQFKLEDASELARPPKRVKIEDDSENGEDVSGSPVVLKKARMSSPTKRENTSLPRKPTPSSSSSPRKPTPIKMSLAVPHPAPERWRETYAIIKEMRKDIVAPVDTMGCDTAQLKEIEPKNQRFATLISLMLSSQTKDEVTDAAVSRLREAVGGTLSVDAILQAEDSTISEAICKVGYWRKKTIYIQGTAQKLRDEFDSDVPKTVDELSSLPGVGPKMAFLLLQVAWNINLGIGVDVHVHRITNRLGWHNPPTKTPEATRLNLQSWLPTDLHKEINHMLVGFGQAICQPRAPKCGECKLSTTGLCPSVQMPKPSGKGKDKKAARPAVEIELQDAD